MNIKSLVRTAIQKMSDLKWGSAPEDHGIRLMFGENPYPYPTAMRAIKYELEKINLYPDSSKAKLRTAIARYTRFKPDWIFPGNGSDSLIELIAKVFIEQNDEVIMPIPSFPAYQAATELMGGKLVDLKLEKNFSLNLEDLLKTITKKTKLIWLANPNNPTGNILFKRKQIEDILKNFSGILAVDECYYELSSMTCNSLIRKYKNLIVLRSFSKSFGLAGLRLGYIIAHPDIIAYLEKSEGSSQVFAVNRFAQAAGASVLQNIDRVNRYIDKFIKQKERYEYKLSKIKHVEVIPTKTSFLLVKTPLKAFDLKEKLEKYDIYVKDCSIYQNMDPYLIYLGLPHKKNQRFVKRTIKRIVKKEMRERMRREKESKRK